MNNSINKLLLFLYKFILILCISINSEASEALMILSPKSLSRATSINELNPNKGGLSDYEDTNNLLLFSQETQENSDSSSL